VTWTVDQVLGLAPDQGVAHAAQGVAPPRGWVQAQQTEGALWGECQGSGKVPYRTIVDLSGPAFKCSCPSRKFPCKHSLGLFLAYAANPAGLEHVDPPPWVAEWLAGRRARADRQQERQERPQGAADPTRGTGEQERRARRREERVQAGAEELERWLEDVARAGLTDLAGRPRDYFDRMAARLVDAQAPGLARRVRWLGVLPHTGSRWPERMLIELGRVTLLLEAWHRLESLDDHLRADVRAQIGFAESREEILAGPAVADEWNVLGRRVVGEERLRVQRTWLWGATSGHWVLVLDFAAGPQQAFEHTLVPGTRAGAEVCFYPGAAPRRALLKGKPRDGGAFGALVTNSIEAALRGYADALSLNPWLERFPMLLGPVVPRRSADDSWSLVDESAARVALDGPAGWHLLAMSGGYPLSVFGEWDGFALWPLGALVEHTYSPLTVAAA
jgi:hypothetical protein